MYEINEKETEKPKTNVNGKCWEINGQMEDRLFHILYEYFNINPQGRAAGMNWSGDLFFMVQSELTTTLLKPI